jgi:glycosyltransferase involved in cell wall biosynthesis
MNTTLVSVIMPCYNQGVYLSQALDSVVNQTYQNWECIIINDGSEDNTENVAQQYCRKDNRIRYIYQENSGVISARNNAIRTSRGGVILPLDADDYIAPEYLEKAVAVLEAEPLCKIVYGKCWLVGNKNEPFVLPDFSIEQILVGNCIHNSALYRREDYNLVGGYNSNMVDGWEDYDFWLSILETEQGSYAHQINEVLFYYRVLNISRSSRADANERKLRLQIVDNHKQLYWENYLRLYNSYIEIVSSRWFKIFRKCHKILDFFIR